MGAASVALAGNPNSGKTTLFNGLTGARQHVGNYPGVTVEKKQGFYVDRNNKVNIVDLPGTYSLTAYSVEEVVARDYLINERPVVINILDASNLERNLYLTLQFLELGVPVCVALNMMDVADKRGIHVDVQKLSSLLGVPVVPIIARSGKGRCKLMRSALRLLQSGCPGPAIKISYGDDLDQALREMEKNIRLSGFLHGVYPPRWVALKYLENDKQIISRGREADSRESARLERIVEKVTAHLQQTLDTYPEALIADHRYGFINALVKQGIINKEHAPDRLYVSDRIDAVVTNRFLGPIIMIAVLMGLYQFTFSYSGLPVEWCEGFFAWLGGVADGAMAEGLLKSLVISGIIDGVGGVLGFAPIIMFMFFGISLLEDSGYLARVAYMLDRVFRMFGLHGSSVMPYILSGGIAGGCAVPGVMATRTLKSPRERLATMLTAPFMNCGAKLPVFALLIGAFFARHEAVVMLMLTLIAWAGALLIAKLFRQSIVRGEPTPFVMELPPYRLPTFQGLLIHTWERTWQYVKKAGTVILGISILLWAMMTFPQLPASERANFERTRRQIVSAEPPGVVAELQNPGEGAGLSSAAQVLRTRLQALGAREAEAGLLCSIAGRVGKSLEGVSRWAGFDWRTNIALVGGFAAKEVIVSTLGTAYSLGKADPESAAPLSEMLAAHPGWNSIGALSMIVFVMFYSPCFIAVVCIARESGSWKWGLFSMVFNTAVAFSLAVLVYQIGSALT